MQEVFIVVKHIEEVGLKELCCDEHGKIWPISHVKLRYSWMGPPLHNNSNYCCDAALHLFLSFAILFCFVCLFCHVV